MARPASLPGRMRGMHSCKQPQPSTPHLGPRQSLACSRAPHGARHRTIGASPQAMEAAGGLLSGWGLAQQL